MLVASDDKSKITKRFEQEFPSLETIKSVYEKVCDFVQMAVGDGLYASMPLNLHEFCRREKIYIGTVMAVMDLLEQNGYMTLTEEMENPAKVMFCVSRDLLVSSGTGMVLRY